MAQTFECASCNRTFAWKPPLAGKRVRCKCGGTIDVPAEPPVLIEVESNSTEASAAVAVPPTAVPVARKPASSANADALMARLGRAPARVSHLNEQMLAEDRARSEALRRPSLLRDVLIPIVLIAAGLALAGYELTSATAKPAPSVAAAAPTILIRAVLAAGLMLLTVFLATKLADIALMGSFGQSILKLIGIAVGPMAVYGICTHMFGTTSGPALGTLISVVVFWLLFFALLRLDAKDTTIMVILTWIVVTASNYIAYKIDGARSNSWI
jgi:hypothetical protein